MNTRAGGPSREPGDDRVLEALFAHAKPREAPPSADEADIREAVYAQWDAMTGRRVWLRRAGGVAAAMIAVSAAALLAVNAIRAPDSAVIAHVERIEGVVEAGTDAAGYAAIGPESALTEGTVVATREGQIGLRLAGGGSLRLGPRTRLRLTAAAEAELLAGTLYFDSENALVDEAFAVRTALGSVSDVGTQFIARIEAGKLEVGVRDGLVAVTRGADRADVSPGERLVVERGSGTPRRDAIATFGDDWAWVERLAPPFQIDGRTLTDFLTWVSAQTGREIAFDAPDTERLARTTVLSGSVDLEPLPKLAAVLAITDLSYTIDGGTILISDE